jgi:hypothetical protein
MFSKNRNTRSEKLIIPFLPPRQERKSYLIVAEPVVGRQTVPVEKTLTRQGEAATSIKKIPE